MITNTITLTMSLVLSRKNLTPTRTPAITMAMTTAHVTPMITCFLLTRDFFPSPEFPSCSACSNSDASIAEQCYVRWVSKTSQIGKL